MSSHLTMALLDAYSLTAPQRPVKKTKRPRDSQKSRVYAAERFLPMRTTNVFGSREKAQRYVDEITMLPWFRARFGVVSIPVRIGGKGGWAWPDGTISLGTWARNPVSALHEITHIVTRREHGQVVQAHGPEFTATYLFLIRHAMGDDLANKLRASYVQHRVKNRATR